MQAGPLLELDDVVLTHCASAVVLTANERLSDALIRAYDAHHEQLGLSSWAAPRVTTLAAYMRGRHAVLTEGRRSERVLLSEVAQRLAWLEHQPPDANVDGDGLYAPIASAWRLLHDWELTAELPKLGDNENHRLFRDWADAFVRAAKVGRWITEPELPALLTSAILHREMAAETLLLVGFDVVPPSLRRFIEAHRSVGADVRFHAATDAPAANVETLSCEDPQQELRAAIYWARDLLRTANRPIAIGIALPNLTDRHEQVVSQVDAILRPNDFASSPAVSPYNISGGISLSDIPVIAAALDLLAWLHEPRHYTRVDALLRSPFFNFGIDASKSHDSGLPETYDAARFSRLASGVLPRIVARAKRLGYVRLDAAVDEIRRLLEIAGWPNARSLSSESFQAHRTFLQMIDELSAESALIRPRDFASMVARICSAADRRLFAPERPAAPLQILGYLETVGLQFTHLWVTGLGESDWPGPPDPNPFIPLRLQRTAGVPRSDADGELAFCRHMTRRWRGAAPSVTFSYSRTHDDHPSRPSSLVGGDVDAVESRFEPRTLAISHPYLVNTLGTRLEARNELGVGEVSLDRLRHRGSALLRDQSACPFRAFARYRLHATQGTPPHSFPDANERGVATHAALRDTFDRLGPEIDFARIEPAVIQATVDAAAADAIATYRRFPVAYQTSERDRLRDLVLEWLRIEAVRPGFCVFAAEHEAVLSLAGVDFDLRIDRIDQIHSEGGLLVIDFKTGPVNPNSVMGERPQEPQLPLYALSVANVGAIAFAQVRTGECRMVGWTDRHHIDAFAGDGVRLNAAPPVEFGGSWDALVQSWRDRLTLLADEFRNGVAAVKPRDTLACKQCDLHALCRIREMRRFDTA